MGPLDDLDLLQILGLHVAGRRIHPVGTGPIHLHPAVDLDIQLIHSETPVHQVERRSPSSNRRYPGGRSQKLADVFGFLLAYLPIGDRDTRSDQFPLCRHDQFLEDDGVALQLQAHIADPSSYDLHPPALDTAIPQQLDRNLVHPGIHLSSYETSLFVADASPAGVAQRDNGFR